MMVKRRRMLKFIVVAIIIVAIMGSCGSPQSAPTNIIPDPSPNPTENSATTEKAPSCTPYHLPATPTASPTPVEEREEWAVGIVTDNSSSVKDTKERIEKYCNLARETLLSYDNNLRIGFFQFGASSLNKIEEEEACKIQSTAEVTGSEAFDILRKEIRDGRLKGVNAIIYITDGKPGGSDHILAGEERQNAYYDELFVIALEDPSETWSQEEIFPYHIILGASQVNGTPDDEIKRQIYQFLEERLPKESVGMNSVSDSGYLNIQLESARYPVAERWCQSQLPALYLVVNGHRVSLQDTASHISRIINSGLNLGNEDRITARELLQNWFIEVKGKRCQIAIADTTENLQDHFLEALLHQQIWPLLLQEGAICEHFYIGWVIRGQVIKSEAIVLQEKSKCYQVVIERAELDIRQENDSEDNVKIEFRVLNADCLQPFSSLSPFSLNQIDVILLELPDNIDLFIDKTGGQRESCIIDGNKLRITKFKGEGNKLSIECLNFKLTQEDAQNIGVILESDGEDISFQRMVCDKIRESGGESGQTRAISYECANAP